MSPCAALDPADMELHTHSSALDFAITHWGIPDYLCPELYASIRPGILLDPLTGLPRRINSHPLPSPPTLSTLFNYNRRAGPDITILQNLQKSIFLLKVAETARNGAQICNTRESIAILIGPGLLLACAREFVVRRYRPDQFRNLDYRATISRIDSGGGGGDNKKKGKGGKVVGEVKVLEWGCGRPPSSVIRNYEGDEMGVDYNLLESGTHVCWDEDWVILKVIAYSKEARWSVFGSTKEKLANYMLPAPYHHSTTSNSSIRKPIKLITRNTNTAKFEEIMLNYHPAMRFNWHLINCTLAQLHPGKLSITSGSSRRGKRVLQRYLPPAPDDDEHDVSQTFRGIIYGGEKGVHEYRFIPDKSNGDEDHDDDERGYGIEHDISTTNGAVGGVLVDVEGRWVGMHQGCLMEFDAETTGKLMITERVKNQGICPGEPRLREAVIKQLMQVEAGDVLAQAWRDLKTGVDRGDILLEPCIPDETPASCSSGLETRENLDIASGSRRVNFSKRYRIMALGSWRRGGGGL